MTTFYLIRHGENQKVAGDQPLTAEGRRQALRVARSLMRVPIAALYTSPLSRARQTAQAVADVSGLPLHEDVRLRERANFGDLPGQTFAEFVAMWEACNQDRDLVPAIGLAARANGERLEAWMVEIHRQYPQGTIVACTHGGTITDFLLNHYPPQVLERHRANFLYTMGHCSLTILDFDGVGFVLRALAVDTQLATTRSLSLPVDGP